MIRFFKYLVLFVVLVLSCVEPYWPDLEGRGSVLVVDALITDNPEDQYVLLSLSAPIDSQKFIPVSGAWVVVSDNMGNSVVFSETEAGKYYPANFTGVAGRSYMITITLADGKQYNSGFQQLTVTDVFDSIYYEIESQPTTDPLYPIKGARFYIDNIPAGSTETYYIFQLVETYKYHVDFRLEYIEAGSGLQRVTDPPPTLCWKTSKLGGFYLFKSMQKNESSLQKLPLHFVTFDTKRFSERYSLLVRQISVSKEVFDLYYQINQQNNSGSVFAIQPYNIVGNLKCITDPEEPVLGSFIVGGIKEKRAFFNRPRNVTFTYSACFGQTDGVGYIILRGGSPESPLYFTLLDGSIAYAAEECFLCSAMGGTTERPDFWEE